MLIALSWAIALPQYAFPAFRCGPHLVTYQVFDANESLARGTGVRCVKFAAGRDYRRMAWYGEGQWGNVRYRHLGSSLTTPAGQARFADIYGNGEGTGQAGSGLVITYESSGFPPRVPNKIRVGGPWSEVWIRQSSGEVRGYTHTLGPVQHCGNHFLRSNAYQGGNYVGIRCMMPGEQTWYGEGAHGDSRYAHLGASIVVNNAYRTGAFDICDPALGQICNAFNFGALTLRRGFDVVHFWEVPEWGERWVDHTD